MRARAVGAPVGAALVLAACGGAPDGSFGGGDGIAPVVYSATSEGSAVAVAGGDAVVSASVVRKRGDDFGVARQHADGSPDTSFGGYGTGRFTWDSTPGANVADRPADLVVGADGKIVVTGTSGRNVVVLRLTSAGVLDTTFSGDGVAVVGPKPAGSPPPDVALAPQGRIVVVNGDDVVRLTASGGFDSTFGSGGTSTVAYPGGHVPFTYLGAVAVRPDGRVVVGGDGGDRYPFVAQLTTTGALDTPFGADGGGFTTLGYEAITRGLSLQGDGSVLALRRCTNCDGASWALVRVTADGRSYQSASLPSGVVATSQPGTNPQPVSDPVEDSTGRILVAGPYVRTCGERDDACVPTETAVVRLTPSLAVDTSYGSNGIATADLPGGADSVADLALASGDRPVTAGTTARPDTALVRFTS